MARDASPVVLVHGAWHGPWCWERVTPLLAAAGIRWQSLDLPTMRDDVNHQTSVRCDAAVLRDELDALDEPAVVIGHSYGGMVITEGASDHANARHLVYLAAFMPDTGESVLSLVGQVPNPDLFTALKSDERGRSFIAPEFVGPGFYNDCDDATVAWAAARQRPMNGSNDVGASAAAWRSTPSTYVVCGQDKAILPELQRKMSTHATRVVEWDTSHSPFASQPELVANLLIDIARAR